jgi:hypothetical protein
VIKIEYEYGAKQNDWDFEIPRTSWQALNMLTRKKYGENFPLFIKSSPTFRSFFAIDCRNNFVQENSVIEILKYNLDFETDNEFYRIYWDNVDKNKCVVGEKFVDKNICLVEDDNWVVFYRFLWNRFLKEFENKPIN